MMTCTTIIHTIHNSMYPIVKEMLDKVCEVGKKEMKVKPPSELGSWKNAVTTADGTWQTRVGIAKMPNLSSEII